MSQDEYVVVSAPRTGVAQLTLNRPESLNALNHDVLRRIQAALTDAEDDPAVKVVVVTGSGRAFCAGLDLKATGSAAGAEHLDRAPRVHRNQEQFARLATRIVRLSKPTIAAVNGPCVGAGMGLALSTDIRVAAQSAYFSAPFIKIGLSGGDVGLSWQLPRAVGLSRSMDILYTGRRVQAREALEIGLVSRLAGNDTHLAEALDLAAEIAEQDELALMLTKRALWSNAGPASLEAALELENRTQTFAASNGGFYRARDKFADAAADGESK